MNFERNDGGYQPKGMPNGNCCEPPKGGSAMQDEFDEPMNPYAAEDFKNAVNKAMNNFSEGLKKMGEQMKADFPFTDFADIGEEYSGVIRLPYMPNGAWNDVFNILACNGYKVSADIEDATETERELDKVDRWIVIAFEGCE